MTTRGKEGQISYFPPEHVMYNDFASVCSNCFYLTFFSVLCKTDIGKRW